MIKEEKKAIEVINEKIEDINNMPINTKNKYATYGRTEFKEGLRFARLYKSKKTALKHYFDNTGNYNDLKLVKIEIKILEEEKIKPDEFAENRSRL